ncbi:MAG TPA: ATP-dependent DNA helicase RecG [Rhodospirillaceae bacterium]|nr:ATP-dependent DNA helicase RecG [Rhodospirillaceae bacterium]
MRPRLLYPLFEPVERLKGVGPRLAKLIAKAAGERVVDLLWHLPFSVIDRSKVAPIGDATDGNIVTMVVRIERHKPAARRGLPYRIEVTDASAAMTLVFFNARPDYLMREFPPGEERLVSGKAELRHGQVQMVHPDIVAKPDELHEVARLEPVYGLTAGLTAKVMRNAVQGALERLPEFPDWLPDGLAGREQWSSLTDALKQLHGIGDADIPRSINAPARRRVAYDELLADQLALALVRQRQRRQRGRPLPPAGALRQTAIKALPFPLTGAQTRALQEIDHDLGEGQRMLRLLQGDVGSGKTVVALTAMLAAVESRGQAAFMVPTEILSRQHLETLTTFCKDLPIRIQILTGRNKGRPRQAILEDLAQGRIDIMIGTHALFTEDVVFKDLALTVIDEQHRFGVHQRLNLGDKGAAADVLVMTATPIPRTLSMTVYGDMDISLLHGKPPGREPVDTRSIPLSRLDQVVAGVRRAVDNGARAFWVCPLVEENEQLDLAAAKERHGALARVFGADQVGLVHSRISTKDKDAAMAAFVVGETKILVATTVIEVGVDVPEATTMVIEHAERFGLAQLHQLRGRVGRGGQQSHCLLLYAEPLGETARARIAIMRETDDGFRIAEEDLRLRGTGELLGTRQSGFPNFRLADPMAHQDLMEVARDDARLILAIDPNLEGLRGDALRTLLYLFEREAAVKLLRSG